MTDHHEHLAQLLRPYMSDEDAETVVSAIEARYSVTPKATTDEPSGRVNLLRDVAGDLS